MAWPLSQDYNEAIQSPATNFVDADLRQGAAVVNNLGLPMPCSGNFADVYEVRCPDGHRWAVKCFTREVPGLRERYHEISRRLGQVHLPFTVDFTYLDQGIRVAGHWYPVVKMQWVEGFNLNTFVRDNLNKPAVLQNLCEIWQRLAAKLSEADVAHCDLQHGNVLLVPGTKPGALAVRLVDYDGIYVPSLKGMKSFEAGHASYQHPRRLKDCFYGPEIDRFSHLVIYTALRALIAGGAPLWNKYDNGDNMLFSQKDFEDPSQAAVFQELAKSGESEVKMLTRELARAAQGPIEEVPLLEELPKQVKSVQGPKRVKSSSASTRRQSAIKAPGARTPYYLAASAGGLVLVSAILFFALRGSEAKENGGPEGAGDSPPTELQHAGLARPVDVQSPLPAQSPAEPEPKKDSEPKKDLVVKYDPEPNKDAEPKKDPVPEPVPEATNKRLPVPEKEDLAKAEKRVKEQFKTDYAKRNQPDILALANKLRALALDTKNDPSIRFVLLNETRKLGAQAGDEKLALQAVDDLALEYQINPLVLKCETLEITADTPTNVAGHKALVGYALQVMDRALAEDNFDAAARLLKVSEIAATKSKVPSQAALVQARAKELDELRKEYKNVRTAADVLAKDARDPAANLVLGRYLCFAKGDWNKGLLSLARCGDESLASVAKKDLAQPDDADAQAEIGDDWWRIARQLEGVAKARSEGRARHWYRQCFGQLAGLRKKEIEDRLKLLVGNLELRPGLVVELFGGENVDKWVKSRIDPNINFDWGNGSPDKDIVADHFSCRWQGWLLAPKPGAYTLVTISDAGTRVLLDGNIIIDKWDASRPAGRQEVEVQLTSKPHHIEVNHTKGTPTASMVLLWIQHDGFAERPVPPDVLYHDQDQEELASQEPYRRFKGKWTVRYTNRVVREYTIDAGGTVSFVEGGKQYQGRFGRHVQDTILSVGDGKLERFRLDKGKLVIEHFNPASDYPTKVNQNAVGTKKE